MDILIERTIPDKPPVTGYSCANRNFLLEWWMNKEGWSADLMAH